MDSDRLKRLDRALGTPVVRMLTAWERLRRAVSPRRAARGRDLAGLARIAIVKTVAIGDVTVSLAAVASLRRRFPDAHITFITTPRVREVVEGLTWVDEILYYDVFGRHSGLVGVARFAWLLGKRRFDAWIELEHYYRFTTILGYLSGARVRVGFDIGGQVRKGLFTVPVAYPESAHEREAFLAIPRALGAEWEPKGYVPIPRSEEDERVVDAWLAEALDALDASPAPAPSGGPASEGEAAASAPAAATAPVRAALAAGEPRLPLLVLHTTTSPIATSRRWFEDRWIELTRRLVAACGLLPVLTGIEEDVAGLEALAARMEVPVLISAGRLTLKQFSALASRAELIVSVDTGPLHVAAATGTPTVGLFGSTNPEKWGPYGPENAWVWAALDCAPCTAHWLGRISECTKGDCMRAISVDDVMGAVRSLPSRPCVAREAATD